MFENSQNTLELSADRSSLSSNATVTGDFSLEVPTVEPAQPQMNYGLFIVPEVNHSDALCRVCVRVAGQCTQNLTQTNGALAVNLKYHVLFVWRDRNHVMFKSQMKDTCLWLVCSQFQQAAAEEGGSGPGKRDPLPLPLHWRLPGTPSPLAPQPHHCAPQRLGEHGDRAAAALASVQRQQLPEGGHFPGAERVVHRGERAHERELHLHQP